MPTDDEYDEEKMEDVMHLFEMDDSESATDSEYDATSDTELLRSRRTKRFLGCEYYKEKCLQYFSILKLFRLVMRRTTDCVGGFVACVACLWAYDCKPHTIRKKSSGCGKALGCRVKRTLKFVLDRKVFLSVSLYGIIAFLAIISNEVRAE
jgi:hypothetical protein